MLSIVDIGKVSIALMASLLVLPNIIQASSPLVSCQLRGGPVVEIDADICQKEGGKVIAVPSLGTNGTSADKQHSIWEASRLTDHETAYKAGKDFVSTYPADPRTIDVQAWVNAYEKLISSSTVAKPASAATMEKRPSVSNSKEIGKDGRFIAYDNGTVLDTQTNLMWAAKDNGGDINWTNAKSYCENYRGGGYSDWRMPTQGELTGLYDAGKTYKSDCGIDVHLTELIRLRCTWPWVSDAPEAAFFMFYGKNRVILRGGIRSPYLALPVRSAK